MTALAAARGLVLLALLGAGGVGAFGGGLGACWATAPPTDALPIDALPTDALPTDALPTGGLFVCVPLMDALATDAPPKDGLLGAAGAGLVALLVAGLAWRGAALWAPPDGGLALPGVLLCGVWPCGVLLVPPEGSGSSMPAARRSSRRWSC